ncbi:17610_t:CDS:1 [Acaulospora colombiana]|uniref:17610_t:CDS:1 n=1 Tax=Acaulospora colombiana TaxID=27376 RepID=A0ACA9L888_9GLOM|nr:17610_t:CDS:1 [Acaulospora colombiana]
MVPPRATDAEFFLHLKDHDNLSSPSSSSPQLSPNTSPPPTHQLSVRTHQDSQNYFSLSVQQPPIVSASLEIFAKICEYLAPLDIVALSRVCKQFHIHLCSKTWVSQAIWRKSRTSFLTYPELPPPQGMDEERYIKITNFDKRCEFCGTNEPGSASLYWEFGIRCCDLCLLKRTVTYVLKMT